MADSGSFTDEKLREYLLLAIGYFKEADLFEFATEVYKLLIPIYEKNFEYNLLVKAHTELQQIYTEIVDCVCKTICQYMSRSIYYYYSLH